VRKDNVIAFKNPEPGIEGHDLLTEVLRQGAHQLLIAAVEAEVLEFLNSHQEKNELGKTRFVRNGYLPERPIQTGIGEISVKVPRVRDQFSRGDGIMFNSSIVPKYLRRTGDLNELIPVLYLKGISTGDFVEALKPILGERATNLSPSVVSRLKTKWEEEYSHWCKRKLSSKHYVYLWADGIYLQARMEDSKDCVLVIMGVDVYGKKELIAIEDGYRESKESWLSLLRDLKDRGLKRPAKVAVGDGSLGFWGALTETYPTTKHQRCWFHKMGNVLDKLPKSQQAQSKSDLQEIWMSATRQEAYKAFDQFIKNYEAKYPKATECLKKDKEELLAFYDFPAEHWVHLRTTNPIESTFATVRHRTKKAKGCFSRTTILTMVFKLSESAQKRFRKIRGFKQLGEVIRNVKFSDGIKVDEGKVNEEKLTEKNRVAA
jgi:transposase-like protein